MAARGYEPVASGSSLYPTGRLLPTGHSRVNLFVPRVVLPRINGGLADLVDVMISKPFNLAEIDWTVKTLP